MLARILVIISAILAVYGFTQLPEPGDAQPPPKSSSQLRLAAALILFLVILLNVGQWLLCISMLPRSDLLFLYSSLRSCGLRCSHGQPWHS